MSKRPKKGDGDAVDPTEKDGKQVIQLVSGFEETGNERLLKKIIPACVISGALHVAIAATFLLFGKLFGTAEAKPMEPPPPLAMEAEEEKPKPDDLTKTNEGLETEQDTSIEVMREAPVTIEAPKVTEDPIGSPETDSKVIQDSTNTLGSPSENVIDPGTKIDAPGLGIAGDGGLMGSSVANPTLGGRSAATRDKMVTANGGSTGSQLAVGRGLAWLAAQQKADGTWVWDGSNSADLAASTGLALLPFLAAGQTHKVADWKEDGKVQIKYKETVLKGLMALIRMQKPDGSFKNSPTMYTHGIASVALCEAYGMTGDKSLLLGPAQKSINFIMAAQGTDGSWGYQPKSNGDTSIVGWQIQALQSAKLCKDMVVDKRVMDKARSFLDSVAEGSNKAKYGYRAPKGTPTLTSVGLLCRYYMDGWGPNNPGMADGVDYLRKSMMPGKGKTLDMYYYYYASQVMHFHDGEVWKEWNVLMRDWLIELQAKDAKNAKDYGSWNKDASPWIGGHCGRLGTTCMALLTLEIYYRHTPLNKRDQGGLKELENK
jgi:hypothetical protein